MGAARLPVAIDLDNVVAATDPKIRQIICLLTGISLSQEDVRTWDYADALTSMGMNRWEAEEAVREAFEKFHGWDCLDVAPVAGALERVQRFVGEGIGIQIVTSRPDFEQCRDLTRQWLGKFSIPGSWLRLEANKASVCAEWNCLVHDNPQQAREAADRGAAVFLLEYPWNMGVQSHRRITRVRNWDEIGRGVLASAAR